MAHRREPVTVEKKGVIQRNIVVFDCVCALLAPVAAFYLRGVLESKFELSPAILPYAASGAVASIVLLWWLGVSRAVWCFFAFSDAVKAFQAIALGIGVGVIFGFANDRLESVARSIPFIQIALQGAVFVGVRQLAQRLLADRTEKPARPTGVLLVGCNRTAETYVRAVELLSQGSLEIAGILTEDISLVGLTLRGKPILGLVSDAKSVVQTLQVHGIEIQKIVIAVPESSLARPQYAELDQLIFASKIPVMHVDSLFGEATSTETVQEAAHPDVNRALGSYGLVKNLVDLAGSSLLLVLTAPLFALVTLLTLADIGRPVYFWQQRLGRRGRVITLFKFRTMRSPVGADGEVLEDSKRTSAIGHFLRKTRLDELPQLLHIFHGEMSFVGPRPLLPIDQPEEIMERLSVRPGLTGWAQVNGGKLVTPEEKGALDLYYVAHASLWMDLKIAWLTVLMFLRGDRLNEEAIRQAQDWLKGREPQDPVLPAPLQKPPIILENPPPAAAVDHKDWETAKATARASAA